MKSDRSGFMCKADKSDFSVRLCGMEPHPIFEIITTNIDKFIAWLLNPVLGDIISVGFREHLFYFSCYEERRQFAQGFHVSNQLLTFDVESLRDQVKQLEEALEFASQEFPESPTRFATEEEIESPKKPISTNAFYGNKEKRTDSAIRLKVSTPGSIMPFSEKKHARQ